MITTLLHALVSSNVTRNMFTTNSGLSEQLEWLGSLLKWTYLTRPQALPDGIMEFVTLVWQGKYKFSLHILA